ncbi:acyltransferase family protein, partial [Nocardia brasiliensis]|uniref:acyltransferase family protein n=1 Tax=Nocardia brasiliensis TaxID=37326 RepID=UPI0032AF2437
MTRTATREFVIRQDDSAPRVSLAQFRPDVEGLRAVAVLAVVAFHAGLGGIDGGFVGVDVFFVISGFLITGMLWREVSGTGTIALARFYGGRAPRQLPAAGVLAGAAPLAPGAEEAPIQAPPGGGRPG